MKSKNIIKYLSALFATLFMACFHSSYAGDLKVEMQNNMLLLSNGLIDIKLNPDKGFVINHLSKTGTNNNLILRATVSYMARGDWKAEEGNFKQEEAFGKTKFEKTYTDNFLEIVVQSHSNEFDLVKKLLLTKDKPYVKISYEMTAVNSFWLGGGDPPGGVTIPLLKYSPVLKYMAYMQENEFLVKTQKDLSSFWNQGALYGLNWYAVCTEDMQQGLIVILDRSPWKDIPQDGFLTSSGITHSYTAMKELKKGDPIKCTVYLAPFAGDVKENAEKIMVDIFGNTNGISAKSKKNNSAQTYTGVLLKKLENCAIWTAGTEKVFSDTPVPAKKAEYIKISAAKGESESFQLIRAC